MRDKLEPPSSPFSALPDMHIVELAGRDAATFSQAQFINDVNGLRPGQWHWSGWLTPKGRVVAIFALAKWTDERIWLLLPDVDPDELVAGLRRFVFRSKVVVSVRDDVVGGAFVPSTGGRDGTFIERNGVVEFDFGTEQSPRCLRVGTEEVTDTTAVRRWRAFDLEHGLPRLAPEQFGQWTPQQLSLERLRGFSVRKGCYPGQEIVARTHFLGKAKRGLVLLEADGTLTPGDEVRAADKAVGSVVSTAEADGRHLALAVLPLDRDATAFEAGAAPVREIPIRPGLAR